MRPWRPGAIHGRPARGNGRDRHLEEPGQPPVRGDRREGRSRANGPSARKGSPGAFLAPLRLMDRCDQPEGAPRRPDRVRRGHAGRGRGQPALEGAIGPDPMAGRLPGMAIGASGTEPFWTGFPRDPVRSGLGGAKLAADDAHEGIKTAAACVLSTTWQRCRMPFQRNALAHAGRNSRRIRRGNDPPVPFPARHILGRLRHRLRPARSCGGQSAMALRRRPDAAQPAEALHSDGDGRAGRPVSMGPRPFLPQADRGTACRLADRRELPGSSGPSCAARARSSVSTARSSGASMSPTLVGESFPRKYF